MQNPEKAENTENKKIPKNNNIKKLFIVLATSFILIMLLTFRFHYEKEYSRPFGAELSISFSEFLTIAAEKPYRWKYRVPFDSTTKCNGLQMLCFCYGEIKSASGLENVIGF